MSAHPPEPNGSNPDATMAEPPEDRPMPADQADQTVMATGEFTSDDSLPLTPPPASPFSVEQSLADPLDRFFSSASSLDRVFDGGATLADAPEEAAPPRRPAPAPPVPQNVAFDATQAVEATGLFTSGGSPAPRPFSPEATLANSPMSDATVQMAATGAFDTDPTSPSDRGNRAALPATDIMSTGDYAAPAAPSRVRSASSSSRCGRYVLRHFHAKGGMGEVWMAEDPDIGRPVALKRMLSERPDQVRRFRVEAQITGQLEHPGIVPVHELGVNDSGQTYYAMKFVQGRTLKKVLDEYHELKTKGAATEVEQVRLLQIFLSLCQTVAYAHSRGVLHRDLKPENVMLGEFGETILLDWGIAKVMGQPDDALGEAPGPVVRLEEGEEGTETRAGAIMGTPCYMAPEVAAGLTDEVDFRSDVYLLGATLYEMLTARQPRTGNTPMELIKKARIESPPSTRTIDPTIPKPLDAICSKAMALLKEDRYASASELAEDVQRLLAGEPVTAYREGFWARTWRWAKRHRTVLGRAAAALVVAVGCAVGYNEVRKAQRESARLAREVARGQERDQARRDLNDFRRLADEASYYAATTDPVAENAPYSDPRKGEETTKSALALAAKWGPALDRLPIEEEKASTAREIEELTRLAAHLKQQGKSARTARLRQKAVPVRLVSYLKPETPNVVELANDSGKALTALDHFFQGESYRAQATRHKDVQAVRDAWKPDPELMEKAIGEYRKALALNPEHYWSHFQIGRCHLSVGRLPEAIEALGACIALRPESPWGYSVRGFALSQQKRYAEAERDLDRAIQLNPELRPSRLNRGVVYWKQQKLKEAMADFAAVLEGPKEQHLIEAAYYRGMIHAHLGENKSALREFDRVVNENPRYRPVYYYRASIHFANGDEPQGLEDVDAYIANGDKIDREGWMIHGVRGHLLRAMHAEQPAERRREKWGQALATLAIGELKQAIALGGDAYDLFDDLGAMFEHTGQANEAVGAYTKGLQVASDNVKLRNKRGWLLEAFGRHDDALADFAAAAKASPDNAEAHTGLGYVRAIAKQATEAQREADLALVHGADEFLVLHNVACIYSTLSEIAGPRAPAYQDVAIAVLKRAIIKWKSAETPLNEIDLIKAEPAFKSLHGRPDFQKLIAPEPAVAKPDRPA